MCCSFAVQERSRDFVRTYEDAADHGGQGEDRGAVADGAENMKSRIKTMPLILPTIHTINVRHLTTLPMRNRREYVDKKWEYSRS